MTFHGTNYLSGPGIVLNILKISQINIKYMASSHDFLEFPELLHLKILNCFPDGGGAMRTIITKLATAGVHN
jgi:hypothetical protein